ncbi:MFS general substrate transporter [Lentinula edodes]|uniref:Autophagy-related protein n=1 Tax=Lentinula edodes TaxID=5353 RepID=A0A1Q3EK84_LENED|nr:MFS general substrate transporter [Lentinula edodes]
MVKSAGAPNPLGRFGGLTTQGEMFGLAVYFGFVLGAFNGYARAFYAEFLPPGEEARWYGLYSITDKSSSFFGPFIVGLISDLTGNIRYSFFFLVVMLWAAIPVLKSVNVERGRRDAQSYKYSSIMPHNNDPRGPGTDRNIPFNTRPDDRSNVSLSSSEFH